MWIKAGLCLSRRARFLSSTPERHDLVGMVVPYIGRTQELYA